MSARVLIVDDVRANLKLLEVRLSAEYFEVVTATSGPEAIDIAQRGLCDIILLDVMMPGMDGFEVARRLKSSEATLHIPIVMVTALDQPSDRVRGLEAGADDFLTKPVNDLALITRVRSLSRLKMVVDELRMRAVTSHEIGVAADPAQAINDTGEGGKILIVDDRPSSIDRLHTALAGSQTVDVESNPQEALFRLAEGNYDLLLLSLELSDFDALRLCGQVRSLERTRHLPILLVTEPGDQARLLRGLDLGANDYIVRPIDRNELVARVRSQVRRKRYAERLRDSVQTSMELAVTDPLTGLYNRRYMEGHVGTLVDRSAARGKSLSVLLLDIDYFKSINDGYGHDAGDDVLRDFSDRLRACIRGIDLACRYGGEEFVVVMPDTDIGVATMVAERIRRRVAGDMFPIHRGAKSIEVTISIGIAARATTEDTAAMILKRADEALYRAKRDGRNRVVADAA
ncbi:MAG: PleD family two-component system response regulator [Xanthobacteraceae bacterium]|nr:PleD family two-component system response regulator [Xanthobacteraceae bacterium]QYK43798.1 MAG: PleD family two-component system response regulator [Xanthobacteraceae bacterium]